MNKDSVKQIFQSKFDYQTYCNEIVHNVFGCLDISIRPEWLDTTADGDSSYYIGHQTDADGRELGFFYTRLADGSDVRRKRVGLRKMIAPYLKYDVDAAIAVFDDGQHWRLSYICDLKEGCTSAKRFSYIMGDEQGQYKTPLERLDNINAKRGRFVLNDLRDAFSVDALSDEFFNEYHVHYDRIVAELARQGMSGAVYHDYVKKLMGRIVFLHFLQKKGWLCGDTNFMLNTFNQSDRRDDYLESVLEPLFFGVLNTEVEKRDPSLRKWASIPYLNGGLFERDAVDSLKIVLPKHLFSDLFSFLASYNFTVDENDPDDAEIGVDPEMLGKIFESLLEDNKAKGAFYTPKEIVRYMCKESLIAYLASKLPKVQDGVVRAFVEQHEMQPDLEPCRDTLESALREVKICDPAIGSGAFPMGLLNELWRCRETLGTQLSRLQLKKEIIENNIYGVDIERGAIDIARLRFWLSIVVDSEQAEPLPNFDYKFMQGNSLIESYGGFDLSRIAGRTAGRPSASTQLVIGLDSHLSRKNLQLLLREYFSVTDHYRKAEMRQAINNEVKTLIRESIGGTPAFLAKLNALDPSANQDFFLWHTWFKDIFDKGGFDIVIGNPPYIQIKWLEAKDKYQSVGYNTFDSSGDIYVLFYEKATRILKEKGIGTFITSNKWLKSNYGDTLRKYLLTNTIPMILIDLGAGVFETASVDTNILLWKKEKNNNGVTNVISLEKNSILTIKQTDYKQMRFTKDGLWGVTTSSLSDLQNRIEKNPLHINDYGVELFYGILTGANPTFIIDKATADRLSGLDAKNKQLIKPILRGKDIDRYCASFNNVFLLCVHNGIKHKRIPPVNIQRDYPTLIPYFRAFGEWFLHRGEQGDNYWNLRNCAYLHRFSEQKIIYADIVQDYGKFYLDRDGYYTNDTAFIIVGENLEFLIGILNSRLFSFVYKNFYCGGTLGNKGLRFKRDYILRVPFPKTTLQQRQEIIVLVEQIISKKKTNPHADTSEMEQEIDQKVYELYGLSPEEIAVIEK